MSRLPVRDLDAQSVADLVAKLEERLARAEALAPLAPACYGAEIAVSRAVLQDLDDLLRRPLQE